MITDCFDLVTEPMLSLRDFYGEPKQIVDKCLILFSHRILTHLLETWDCQEIAHLGSCNGRKPIYKLNYKGEEIAFYLSSVGSALASTECYETSWVTGARKFIIASFICPLLQYCDDKNCDSPAISIPFSNSGFPRRIIPITL